MSVVPSDRTKPTPPLPTWDRDTAGFWEAARSHVLAVQTCRNCGAASFPPWPSCRKCGSRELAWTPSDGRGRIFTWTTVYRSTRPEFEQDVPYTLAVVELNQFGVLVPARLRGVAPLEAKIGTPVEARFEDLTPDVSLLYWVVEGGKP